MSVTLARLRIIFTALAVLLLGAVVVGSPASAHQGSIKVTSAPCVAADGTYLVTYELTWSNVPAQAFGTPIKTRSDADDTFDSGWTSAPGSYSWTQRGTVQSTAGQIRWTQTLPGTTAPNGRWEYAWLPWSNGNTGNRFHDTRAEGLAGDCVREPDRVDVSASFTDQLCTPQQSFAAPTMDAPSYAGITRTVAGTGSNGTPDPGETVTVTYQGTSTTVINGADSQGRKVFNHTFPAAPAGLRDCVPQPDPVVEPHSDTTATCEQGVWTRTWDTVTPYVWNEGQGAWVLGSPTIVNDTGFVFVRDLTPAEKVDLDCTRPPEPEALVVPQQDERMACETGVETRAWDEVTPFVFDEATFTWVPGVMEIQHDTGWVLERELTPAEKAELDCSPPEQPEDIVSSLELQEESCELGGVLSWSQMTTTGWTFVEDSWEWVQDEPVVTGTEPVLTAYTTEELLEECPPDVEGEEETDDSDHGDEPRDDVEVRGEQETAAVPTAVDAGAGSWQAAPGRALRSPWLLLVAGLTGLGLAGGRRRLLARR